MNPIKFIFKLHIWLIFFFSAIELTGVMKSLVFETGKVHKRGLLSIAKFNRMLVGDEK